MATVESGTILYGMMGSGKSTNGRLLGDVLRQSFRDTDDIIEAKSGRTCRELVDAGQFPTTQSETILCMRQINPGVVATGGSVAMYPELVQHLRQFGPGVFLKVDPEVLEARILERDPERIAALNTTSGGGFIDVYRERIPAYTDAADMVLEIGDEPEVVVFQRLLDLRLNYVQGCLATNSVRTSSSMESQA